MPSSASVPASRPPLLPYTTLFRSLQSVEFQELWRFNFTGCDPLGFLVAKGVIEMHFSIGCNNFTAVNTDQGIKDLSGTGWFINPGDECYVFGSTELAQSSD